MILMNDFNAEPKHIQDATLAAALRVFKSGKFILGSELLEFEKNWSSTCGTQFGVGVGNGMDALEIALRASDIGPGDEVITTAMTAFATVLAILRSGATPVLADIDCDTALLSIPSVKRCITKKTKAVILVHLYGQLKSMSDWQNFCLDNSILLFEDCAQAHLAAWKGKVAGNFGTAGAYSFYPTKNLGTPGDAGMLVTNDFNIAKLSVRLRNYGQDIRYIHTELGMNSRLDELHAAILNARLRWLPEFTKKKKLIANMYFDNIHNPKVSLLASPQEATSHVYHQFVITCKDRNELQFHLEKQDVQSLIHYPVPIHHQKPCIHFLRDPNGLKNSEIHASNCLSLPIHPHMNKKDIERVILAVNKF
jgi:dTDP-4-amino-4,6-dideoxygalactose transaminase